MSPWTYEIYMRIKIYAIVSLVAKMMGPKILTGRIMFFFISSDLGVLLQPAAANSGHIESCAEANSDAVLQIR